jgi:hypothetical protein
MDSSEAAVARLLVRLNCGWISGRISDNHHRVALKKFYVASQLAKLVDSLPLVDDARKKAGPGNAVLFKLLGDMADIQVQEYNLLKTLYDLLSAEEAIVWASDLQNMSKS